MKLFIVASLVAVASAARLEHLERSYLPPDQGSSQGRYGAASVGALPSSLGSNTFGNGVTGFGSSGFDSNGIEVQAAGARSSRLNSAFPGATINQYLPPDHGPSGANGFSGSHSGAQGFPSQRSYNGQSSFGGPSQFSGSSQFSGASQYGAPAAFGAQSRYQGGQQFGSQGLGAQGLGAQGLGAQGLAGQGLGAQGLGSQGLINSRFPAASRQYLAPQASSSNYPQQAFDEQTGYHY